MISVTTQYNELPIDEDESYLLLTFQAPEKDDATTVPPQNFCFCLDTSGSMEGTSIQLTKKAFKNALKRLRSCDKIAIVTYSDRVHVLQEWIELDDSLKAQLSRKLEIIHCLGGTNLSGGLFKCIELSTQVEQCTCVFFTDGRANQGITDVDSLINMSQKLLPTTSSLHTIGVGKTHEPRLLSDLALKCNGTYTYVENDDLIPDALQKCIATAYTLAFQNLTLELQSHEINFSTTDKEPFVEVALGDVYCTEKKEYLFHAKILKKADEYRIGYSLTGVNVLQGTHYGHVGDIYIMRGADNQPNPTVQKNIDRVAAIQSIYRSLRTGERRHINRAKSLIAEDSELYKSIQNVNLNDDDTTFRFYSLAREYSNRISPIKGVFGDKKK